MKEGTVWDDLEFLERTLELARDSYTREKISLFIRQAKARVLASLQQDFADGLLSTQAFKNITHQSPPTKNPQSQDNPPLDLNQNAIDTTNEKFSEFAKKALGEMGLAKSGE